jgi:hypothetical protein
MNIKKIPNAINLPPLLSPRISFALSHGNFSLERIASLILVIRTKRHLVCLTFTAQLNKLKLSLDEILEEREDWVFKIMN